MDIIIKRKTLQLDGSIKTIDDIIPISNKDYYELENDINIKFSIRIIIWYHHIEKTDLLHLWI